MEALGVPPSFPQQGLFPSGASGALLVATEKSGFEQLYDPWTRGFASKSSPFLYFQADFRE